MLKYMSMGRSVAIFPNSESGGVAIILVIWVIVILTAIAGEFSFSMRNEINIARNFKEEEEAYQLALAGIESAKQEILVARSPAEAYLNANNLLILNENKDEDEGEPERKESLGKGTVEYTITDENGKLNINTASKEQIKYIFLDSGVDSSEVDTIIDSIIDWRDSNDLHQLNGAEEDYYRSLDRPYSAKDGPFDSITELLLVKGMTSEILYGSSKSVNAESDDEEDVVYNGVADKLTVAGSDININTASAVVLEAVLGIESANYIVTEREEGALKIPIAKGKISSDYFTIISSGANRDGTIRRSIKAMVTVNKDGLDIVYWQDNYRGYSG